MNPLHMNPPERYRPGLHMFTQLSLGIIVGEQNPVKDAKIGITWL
jgi:hypothetical protein